MQIEGKKERERRKERGNGGGKGREEGREKGGKGGRGRYGSRGIGKETSSNLQEIYLKYAFLLSNKSRNN